MIRTRSVVERDNYLIEVLHGEEVLAHFESYPCLPMQEFQGHILDCYYSACLRNDWPRSYMPELELHHMQMQAACAGVPNVWKAPAKDVIWYEYARRRNAKKYFENS